MWNPEHWTLNNCELCNVFLSTECNFDISHIKNKTPWKVFESMCCMFIVEDYLMNALVHYNAAELWLIEHCTEFRAVACWYAVCYAYHRIHILYISNSFIQSYVLVNAKPLKHRPHEYRVNKIITKIDLISMCVSLNEQHTNTNTAW